MTLPRRMHNAPPRLEVHSAMIRKPSQMRVETREKLRGGAGAVTFRHYFAKEEMGAKVRLCAELIVPPGSGIGPHQHDAEDEVFIVTQGSGILDDGQTRTRIETGDAILTGKGASHAVHNDGAEDLHMIAVIACY
jgi:mannose-6-phosphate isomerase-like protein (cupin superfamily)